MRRNFFLKDKYSLTKIRLYRSRKAATKKYSNSIFGKIRGRCGGSAPTEGVAEAKKPAILRGFWLKRGEDSPLPKHI